VPSFEAFAYDFFDREGYSHLGNQSFGRGIYSKNGTEEFHDLDGHSYGRNDILTPVLQIGNLATNTRAVLFNLYSQEKRIDAIDDMIDCFHSGVDRRTCSAITDVIWLVQDPEFRPAVLVVHPIAPKHNPHNISALVYTVHNWDTIISYSVPSYVTGLDAVLTVAGGVQYTYSIDRGRATLKGKGVGYEHGLGDKHEKKYSKDKRSFDVPFFKGSVDYSIALYPTDRYVAQFRSELPLYACIISVAVILLTSLIFFVYDFFVNRQKYEKELIINTKRLFVRFISHEIRTPMNTVHLGLNLLSSEMHALLRSCDMPEKMKACITDWLGLVSNIGDSSDAAIVVLNDLINYDKISMGLLNIDREMCNFWNIITQAVKPFLVQAKQAGVELHFDLEVQRDGICEERRLELMMLMVYGDTLKLIQVVRNLVSNAIKFTPEGGRVTITGTLSSSAPFIHVFV
jgi:hypothetical protein